MDSLAAGKPAAAGDAAIANAPAMIAPLRIDIDPARSVLASRERASASGKVGCWAVRPREALRLQVNLSQIGGFHEDRCYRRLCECPDRCRSGLCDAASALTSSPPALPAQASALTFRVCERVRRTTSSSPASRSAACRGAVLDAGRETSRKRHPPPGVCLRTPGGDRGCALSPLLRGERGWLRTSPRGPGRLLTLRPPAPQRGGVQRRSTT
jgi:hypothetical protein